jgi:hypothetical protein
MPANPQPMIQVILDVSTTTKLVRVEGRDDQGMHYLGAGMGAKGTTLLKSVLAQLESSTLGQPIPLNVVGTQIVP